MKMPGNLGSIMKQAQEMQTKMKAIQDDLKSKEIESSAGGDMVTLKMTGEYEITSLKIKPEVVTGDDIEMLEDLVTAAVNEGVRKVKEMSAESMGELTGGMNIPGMGNLF